MPGFELIGEEERAAIEEIFADGGILFRHGFDGMRNGRYRVIEFEKAFAEKLGARHALAVTSGTAALKVALKAMGVGPGDEVIFQSFTFIATAEAIADCGAQPVVVNIDDTLNMDPTDLERAITPRTRAILPVHMLGVAAEMDDIMSIAQARNIPVLEDNCESLGADWGARKLGTQGTMCAYSLDFGKVITTGEGGMITTDDDELYALAREYHDHGHQNNPSLPRGRDTHRIFGFNYRMTELQAAVGLAQLNKLDSIVEANRRNYQALEADLSDIDGLMPRRIPEKCVPLCDTLIFQLPTAKQADAFVQRMSQEGLGTKNVPDAIDWHFAGYWDHIFTNYGISKRDLWQSTLSSHEQLARCVALPVMVKYTPERIAEISGKLRRIAAEVL
ncbi:MAG: DegT/DnrJ/EryC1/StrS family aminotransferase [Pyrinomonadaceae bacterium]